MDLSIPVMIKILFSAFLGGLIGIERELHRHEAGLRTHILVCLGSTLIMLTSTHVFDIYKDVAPVDPSRIAASVVTGIGFIGAGAIIRYGMAVKGLTTAASLWVASAVGLAIGCDFYFAAVFTTLVVLAVLLFLRKFESVLLRKREVENGDDKG
jgi:putative Mg2+ transporter-C (MgtC) family protein